MFPFYTGKSFEELLDGIARLQMVEQTLYGDARPSKNRFATEDLRILRNNAAHKQNYALKIQSIQANITDLPRRPLAKNFGVASRLAVALREGWLATAARRDSGDMENVHYWNVFAMMRAGSGSGRGLAV